MFSSGGSAVAGHGRRPGPAGRARCCGTARWSAGAAARCPSRSRPGAIGGPPPARCRPWGRAATAGGGAAAARGGAAAAGLPGLPGARRSRRSGAGITGAVLRAGHAGAADCRTSGGQEGQSQGHARHVCLDATGARQRTKKPGRIRGVRHPSIRVRVQKQRATKIESNQLPGAVTKKQTWTPCVLLCLASCIGDVGPGASGGPGSGPGRPPGTPGGGMSQTPGGGGTTTPRPPGTTPTDPVPPPPRERPQTAAVATTRLARLSHRQWENTVRDLLRLPAAPELAAKFTADAFRTFANDGGTLSVSETLRADYQTAAEALAQKVARDPAALGRLLPAGAPAATGRSAPRPSSRTSAGAPTGARWTTRRWRPTPPCSTRGRCWSRRSTRSPPAPRWCWRRMLQSPHFLYRTELTTGHGPGAPGRLRDRREAVLRARRHHARRRPVRRRRRRRAGAATSR